MRTKREDESDGDEIEVERVRKSSNVTLYSDADGWGDRGME